MDPNFDPRPASRDLYQRFLAMSPAERVDFEILLFTDRGTFIGKYLYELNWVAGRGSFQFPKNWERDSRIVYLRDVGKQTFPAIGTALSIETDAVEQAYKRRKKLEARLQRPPQS